MAGTGIRLEPILLKKPIAAASAAKVGAALMGWALETQRRMSAYPAQQPTAYRRTGTLGRRWTAKATTVGRDVAAEVGNNTEYAGYVEGFGPDAPAPKAEKQTRVMQRKGWQRVDDVGEEVFRKARPAIIKALGGSATDVV